MSCIFPVHVRPSVTGGSALEPGRGAALPKFSCLAGRIEARAHGRKRRRETMPIIQTSAESGCASVVCARKSADDDRRRWEGERGVGLRSPWRANGAYTACLWKDLRAEQALYRSFEKWSGCGAREAARERRLIGFNAASFICNTQKQQGGRRERQMRRARAEREEDSIAITVPSQASAMLAELDGSERIMVIGAGAGTPAILDFCRQSSVLPSSAQFWCVSEAAPEYVPMFDLSGDSNIAAAGSNKNPFITQTNNLETIFLVFGVGSGAGLGFVPEQLTAVQSKGSLAVGIFVKPFMFEGAKRLEQAKQVIDSLMGCTDVLLVVEQDRLLRSDAVTVSEASSIAKTAVLLSIKAVMDLVSGGEEVFQDAIVEGASALPMDMKKLFQRSGRAWLGSGRGKTFSEAVEMAVSDAPVPDYRPFESKRLVLCTLAGALDQISNKQEVEALESMLYQALGPEVQLIFKTVRSPMTEKGVKLATIIVTSHSSHPKENFDMMLIKNESLQINRQLLKLANQLNAEEYRCDSRLNSHEIPNLKLSDKRGEEYGTPPTIAVNTVHATGLQQGANSAVDASKSYFKKSSSISSVDAAVPSGTRGHNGPSLVTQGSSLRGSPISRSGNGRNVSPPNLKRTQPNRSAINKAAVPPSREEVKNKDARPVFSQTSLSSSPSQRSRVAWEAGPSSDVAKAWAQARAEARKPVHKQPTLDISLSVGVRLGEERGAQAPNENFSLRPGLEVVEDKWSRRMAIPVDPDALPRNRMVDRGLDAVRDMYNLASALVMGRDRADDGREAASLSQRAASMLESERSQKKLTPLVEMGFKNGMYKGRCQEGLPEGKGRLSFSDGSFYDGHWKQGKRAGAGSFYYTNGDLFQGSWKDDVMHGKGWMYYHNGDRLYANFWKGKAEGEGRFYSAHGDVLFGQFRENWRHGEFLYIEAAGVRWSELWENGVLSSRTSLDS